MPSIAYYAGVDLGGTKTTVGVGDATTDVLVTRTFETRGDRGPEAVLSDIAQVISELCPDAPLAGIGLGVPGLCDLAKGKVLFCPNLTGYWRDVPAAALLSAACGSAPVSLLNDARAATYGEFRFGSRPGTDMILITAGTGIGGGVVLGGQLQLGRFGAAGEIGHQTVVPDGVLCGCGNRGCLETVASGPALTAEAVRLLRIGLAPRLHQLVNGDAGSVSPALMARCGDPAIEEAIERAARSLGVGVANAITIMGVERVVIAGGLAGLGERLLQPVRDEIRKRVRMFPPDDVTVERSTLGDRAGVLGAIAWAAENRRFEDDSELHIRRRGEDDRPFAAESDAYRNGA